MSDLPDREEYEVIRVYPFPAGNVNRRPLLYLCIGITLLAGIVTAIVLVALGHRVRRN